MDIDAIGRKIYFYRKMFFENTLKKGVKTP